MEIERLGENKIRCALSEEEIREMGYNIDEIIGNTEVTQEFMRAVVELVEEQGNISMQNISPVVKAELLQDHSMAITFGGDSEMSFKNLVDTVGQLMNQLAPEKLSEFRQMNKEEKQSAIDDFLEKYKAKHSQDAKRQRQKMQMVLSRKRTMKFLRRRFRLVWSFPVWMKCCD